MRAMSETDLVAAYLQGRITAWTFVRRLLKAGVTLGTALAFTAALPSAARGGDLAPLEALAQTTALDNPEAAAMLNQLLSQLAMSLVPLQNDGSAMPLRNALVRLSLNVANGGLTLNESFSGNTGNVPFSLATNVYSASSQNVVFDPGLVNPGPQNVVVSISGNVGDVPLLLEGAVNVNTLRRGVRGAFVNVSGNAGDVAISFNTPKEK